MTEGADRVVVALADHGHGMDRGYVGIDGSALGEKVGLSKAFLRDAVEELHRLGFVTVQGSISGIVEVKLTPEGRQHLADRGLPVASPRDDAKRLRQMFQCLGEGETRGRVGLHGRALADAAKWPFPRTLEAVQVMENEGWARVRRFMSHDRVHVELTAEGRG